MSEPLSALCRGFIFNKLNGKCCQVSIPRIVVGHALCTSLADRPDTSIVLNNAALPVGLRQGQGRGSLANSLKPVLNWANVCSPNILRTLRRTMIHILIELLVRRIWFGQSKLYFILNWLVMRCKLRPELAADTQQTA